MHIIGCAMLTFHLVHGFQSAFQTLGLAHPQWTPIIRVLGVLLAVTFGLGFASFVVWAQFMPDPSVVPVVE